MSYAIIVRLGDRPIKVLTGFSSVKQADDYVETTLLSLLEYADYHFDIIPVEVVNQ